MYTSNISTRVIAEHWRCPKITRDLALKKIINEEKEKINNKVKEGLNFE